MFAAAFALAACCASRGAAASPAADHNGTYYTFAQRVDHFNESNTATFEQKYYVETQNWKPGGPVFIFLSGEAPMDFFIFQTETIRNRYAVEQGAMYISLEHRMYSTNKTNNPAPDFSAKSLELLSSRQALADAANFIQSYKAAMNNTGPWVVWGCSYSGALSAFFRSQHPDLVVGSIAPSGPVEAIYDYVSFFEHFEAADAAGPACADAARAGSRAVVAMAESNRTALARLFDTCEPITDESLTFFYWNIVGSVGSADQMNNPSNNEGGGNRPWILNTTCGILQRANYTPAENFAAAVAFNNGGAAAAARAAAIPSLSRGPPPRVRALASGGTCTSYNLTAFLEEMADPSNPQRAWNYQKALEFGFFKGTASGPNTTFIPGLNVSTIAGWWSRMFPDAAIDMSLPAIQKRIDATNAYYGGKALNGTATAPGGPSNILFTSGLTDPWHLLEPDQAAGSVGVVSYTAGHCAPMTAPTEIDPPSLKAARDAISDSLEAWLVAAASRAVARD